MWTPWRVMVAPGTSLLRPFWRPRCSTLFFTILGSKKVAKMECFGKSRCDENIANNVPIAYWAVFNAVRVQDHFWEGPGLPFWLHFGDFWVTLAHLGPHRGPQVHLFRASVRTFTFRYVFHSIWGPRGDPKKKVGGMAQTLWRHGKTAFGPSGEGSRLRISTLCKDRGV